MLRAVRWTLTAVAALMLWRFGISIARSPQHEVLYSVGKPFRTCVPQTCTTMLELEVGNTGDAPQSDVIVRFKAAPLAGLAWPMKVRAFGKVDRAVTIEEEGGIRTYHLGNLEPQKRITFQATILGKAADPIPTWDGIFVDVKAANGEASPGDPGSVLFLRMMHALFGWL